MNTYRVYALDVTKTLEPTTHVLYVRGEKYADAWKTARAALNAKPGSTLFTDADAKTKFAGHGDKVTVSRIDDMREKNVKLDKAALVAALNDSTATAEQKLAALKALVG